MPAAISQRGRLAILFALALAGAFTALVAVAPVAALTLVALCLAVALAFAAPVANLTLILFLTMIVPGSAQNAHGIGGGIGEPRFYVADVLLIAGVARAAPVLMRMSLERRRLFATAAVTLLLVIALLQMLHGFGAGWNHSDSGAECRELLYLGTFLLALPILADERARGRLLKSLVGLGLLLGLWGIAQWVLGIGFGGDYGLRPGVRGTTSGRGQIQGGLFVFPAAIVIALSVLVSGQVRSDRGRALLVAVVALNGISLLLTFERSFWVAAMVGTAFVAVKVDRPHRARALAVAVPPLALVVLSLSTLAPSVLTTARERLLAARQYTNDSAFHYRVVESRHVVREIRRHPIIGSGLGATIYWGQPWADAPARNYVYSHDGYLALAWKLGIPSALLLVALIVWAIGARGPPRWGPRLAALRNGCQGGLLAVLVAAITFPSLSKLQVTGVIGVMLAVCATPRARSDPGQTTADVP